MREKNGMQDAIAEFFFGTICTIQIFSMLYCAGMNRGEVRNGQVCKNQGWDFLLF